MISPDNTVNHKSLSVMQVRDNKQRAKANNSSCLLEKYAATVLCLYRTVQSIQLTRDIDPMLFKC